jgi:iron complex transport system substrate-binding protein
MQKNMRNLLVISTAVLVLIFAAFLILDRSSAVETLLVRDGRAGVQDTDMVEAEATLDPSATNDLLDEYKSMVLAEDEDTVTLRDERGRVVTLEKKPERVLLLQNTLLDLWYLAGGTAVGRVSGTTSVPESALDLPEVGQTTTPNLELILAQNPDLVVMNAWTASHVELGPVLEQNGIPFFYTGTSVDPYKNVLRALYVFTRLTGDERAYRENVITIDARVQALIQRVAGRQSPSVLVLFGSSKSVKAEMDNGLVGEMVAMLGGQNVVENVNIEGESKVDFSLEKIVEANPDYILVSTMGDVEAAKDRLQEDIESNEAWSSLTAVQEGRVYFLSKDLYLYKPNARYPEAMQGLLEILYP